MSRSARADRLALLVLSFLPLGWKASVYATLDAYVPLLVLIAFSSLVFWGVRSGGRIENWTIRCWAIALMLWGIARLVVLLLFLVTSVSEAHVESQFTAWYVLLSLGQIALGGVLFRRRFAAG